MAKSVLHVIIKSGDIMTEQLHNRNWVYIDNAEDAKKSLAAFMNAEVLGVDTETTGFDAHTERLRLLQIAAEGYTTLVLDCFKILPDCTFMLSELLGGKAVKVFQNAKFDLQFLWANGVNVQGPMFDTMLAAQILRSSAGPKRAGLDALVEHYLGFSLPKDEQTSDFSGELTDSQKQYAASDAAVLLPLREKMIAHIKDNDLVETARIEFACAYAVADMEYHGIYLDTDKWEKLSLRYESMQKEAIEELYPYTGRPTVQMGFFGEEVRQELNLDSNKQVLDMLRRNEIAVESTSKHELMQYSDKPIVQSIFKYRHASKALSSFLNSLTNQINQKTGRLHPHYMQNGAYSGRMSCSEPNIQQIPREKEFRECFTAPEGRSMIIADYSQIELRVIAQISKDERMIEAYRAGEDLHALTAALISGKSMDDITKKERQEAKAVNFGLVFGMGAAGLQAYAADVYGVNMTLDEANLFKMRFFRGYKGVEAWHKYIKNTLPSFSRTLAGRKHVYGEQTGMSARFNTPVQGSAADILKNALGMLHKRLAGKDAFIVAAVHDEIVLECASTNCSQMAQLLKETMEEAGSRYVLDLPIVADAGVAHSWAEK